MSDPRLEDPDWYAKRDALRFAACGGNESALAFLAMIMDAVEIWDDLIDGDNDISTDEVNRVFINLMFWLPQNEFFDKNKSYLLPIIMTCINAWMDSNALQESNDVRQRQAAWWLKQMGVELYGAIAFIVGGFTHMRKISTEVRTLLMHETFESYETENGHA